MSAQRGKALGFRSQDLCVCYSVEEGWCTCQTIEGVTTFVVLYAGLINIQMQKLCRILRKQDILCSFFSQVVCFTVRRVLNAHVGQSLVHKREFGSFVTTPSFTYLYDHQATDGSKTGSQNIRGSKVGNPEGCHRRRVS